MMNSRGPGGCWDSDWMPEPHHPLCVGGGVGGNWLGGFPSWDPYVYGTRTRMNFKMPSGAGHFNFRIDLGQSSEYMCVSQTPSPPPQSRPLSSLAWIRYLLSVLSLSRLIFTAAIGILDKLAHASYPSRSFHLIQRARQCSWAESSPCSPCGPCGLTCSSHTDLPAAFGLLQDIGTHCSRGLGCSSSHVHLSHFSLFRYPLTTPHSPTELTPTCQSLL